MTDVAQWMARQRWYAAKGGVPDLRTIAEIDETTDEARVRTRFVIDDAPTGPVLYQVPVTEHAAAVDGLDAARIDPDPDSSTPATVDYDGPHDPAYARWLLARIDAGDESLTPIGAVRSARVLRGEQSNTSIICETEDNGTVIVKVFRVLHHGDNPDVTTQQALSAAGSARVPRVFGALRGAWPDTGRADGVASGHLAFAQEFLPGLDDAWRVALDDARRGDSFAVGADRLGAALAEVHVTLAGVMPTEPATADRIAQAHATMLQRLDTAAAEVPAIAEHADAVRAVYARAAAVPWPDLQRIHGDLHLGQVLSAPEPRGWVFLDFEGEPLRPLHERSLPDVPLRDVAGMLRSFDYVAGALAHDDDPVDAGAWAHEARDAFLGGYERGLDVDVRAHREVLDAFEIDKAVYEVVYEARNRPTWVGIPVAAVARLAARSAH
ncbi:maltokinase N-terminal cap-like domain-containing protein [Curtobacterium sp. ZW137]|uniref:maltokinase N-terminal cap-like domain-containing protein n=1 Tax=Curtobacterium sp. ZW137 TaxID=2485104 RepID=UPI000F4C1DE5|nr:phosphotransferase [Curtobacterium sp. ZW137]ROP58761.1 putative trehalose synthase [Curtobacterium sp. ZW137]